MIMNFRNGLRKAGGNTKIERLDITEMANDINCVDFVLRPWNDNLYLHLVAKNGDYYSIKVGKKVVLTSDEGVDQIRELVNDYVVFTGETENGRWFTFGPEPAPTEPIAKVSFKSLFGKKTIAG